MRTKRWDVMRGRQSPARFGPTDAPTWRYLDRLARLIRGRAVSGVAAAHCISRQGIQAIRIKARQDASLFTKRVERQEVMHLGERLIEGYQNRLEVFFGALLRMKASTVSPDFRPAQRNCHDGVVFSARSTQADGSVGSLIQHAALRNNLSDEKIASLQRLFDLTRRAHQDINRERPGIHSETAR